MISKGKGKALLYFGYDEYYNELYAKETEGELYETMVDGKLIYLFAHRECKLNGELYENKWALSDFETGRKFANKENQGCCNKRSKKILLESFVHFIDKIKLCNFWIGIGRGQGVLMQIGKFPLNDIKKWNK